MVTIVARTKILEAYTHQLRLDPDPERACATVALLFALPEDTVRDVASLMYDVADTQAKGGSNT